MLQTVAIIAQLRVNPLGSRFGNPKAAYSKADVCDRAFIGHYQNVMYEMYCFETIGNTIAKLEELIISGMRKVGSVKAILMLSL